MEGFIRDMYARGKITAQKVWSYAPKYISEEQARKIVEDIPYNEDNCRKS